MYSYLLPVDVIGVKNSFTSDEIDHHLSDFNEILKQFEVKRALPLFLLVSETFFLLTVFASVFFLCRVTILSITIHSGQSTEGKHSKRSHKETDALQRNQNQFKHQSLQRKITEKMKKIKLKELKKLKRKQMVKNLMKMLLILRPTFVQNGYMSQTKRIS